MSSSSSVTISTPVDPDSKHTSAWSSADSPRWHRHVRASRSNTIRPVGIVAGWTRGRVRNPEGMILGGPETNLGSNATTLLRLASDDAPVVVVDFGINTVGTVEIEFSRSWLPGDPPDDCDGDDDDDDDDGQEKTLRLQQAMCGARQLNGAAHPRPGIKLAFSESLEFLSHRSDFTRSDNYDGLTQGTDQIAVPRHGFTWLDRSGAYFPDDGKVCSDGLHGFRYLRISLDAHACDSPYTSPYGIVSIKSVKLHLSAFRGTPDTFTGWFECSDSDITQYFYDGAYTNDLCIDVFRKDDTEPRGGYSETLDGKLVVHDAPKRDRDPYVGDMGVAGLTSYYTRGEDVRKAVKNVLVDLAHHQREDGWVPPASIFHYGLRLIDYPLWWVTASYDLVQHTGDVDYAHSVYANLLSVLDDFYPGITNPCTNLVEKTSYYPPDFDRLGHQQISREGNTSTTTTTTTSHEEHLHRPQRRINWGDYAFVPRHGPVTYYNALYVRALRQGAAMARVLGHHTDAHRWEDRADGVAKTLLRLNFDSKTGAFFDGTHESMPGHYVPTHALDGNSIAILENIVGAQTARGIMSYFTKYASTPYGTAFFDNNVVQPDYQQRVYPFISFFELQARFESMMPSSAVQGIRALWGWMAGQDPGVTHWEGIGQKYVSGFTSKAHGWSTGIVALCSAYILGVRPTAPGFTSWEVKPRVGGGITWAQGAVSASGIAIAADKHSRKSEDGRIQVVWKAGPGLLADGWDPRTILAMRVNAPVGTKGRISVPTSFSLGAEDEDALFDAQDGWKGIAVYVNRKLVFSGGETQTDACVPDEHGFVSVDVLPRDGEDIWAEVQKHD